MSTSLQISKALSSQSRHVPTIVQLVKVNIMSLEDPGGDPAVRDLHRVLVSNDVNPQSYAHAYLLILLHLNTELTKNEPNSVKSYETIAVGIVSES